MQRWTSSTGSVGLGAAAGVGAGAVVVSGKPWPWRPRTMSLTSSPLHWLPGGGEESEGEAGSGECWVGAAGGGNEVQGSGELPFLVFIQGGDQGLGFYHGEVSVTQLRG